MGQPEWPSVVGLRLRRRGSRTCPWSRAVTSRITLPLPYISRYDNVDVRLYQEPVQGRPVHEAWQVFGSPCDVGCVLSSWHILIFLRRFQIVLLQCDGCLFFISCVKNTQQMDSFSSIGCLIHHTRRHSLPCGDKLHLWSARTFLSFGTNRNCLSSWVLWPFGCQWPTRPGTCNWHLPAGCWAFPWCCLTILSAWLETWYQIARRAIGSSCVIVYAWSSLYSRTGWAKACSAQDQVSWLFCFFCIFQSLSFFCIFQSLSQCVLFTLYHKQSPKLVAWNFDSPGTICSHHRQCISLGLQQWPCSPHSPVRASIGR